MDAVELDRWQEESVSSWRQRWGVPALRIFRRVGSTNDVARAMAEADAPEGTLVLADEQTRGRGRRGRVWSAPAGASLSLSMILRPPTAEASRILTLRLGLAAARALEQTTLVGHHDSPVRVELKWPNDLRLAGRKVGGILCEGTIVNERVSHVIAGIGLNLRQPADGWPVEIEDRAISLAEAAPGVDVARLVEGIAAEWGAVARHPAEALSESERSQFDARDALRGREITVDERPAGIAEGVSAEGCLRVRSHGAVREIMAGTVRTMESLAGERA